MYNARMFSNLEVTVCLCKCFVFSNSRGYCLLMHNARMLSNFDGYCLLAYNARVFSNFVGYCLLVFVHVCLVTLMVTVCYRLSNFVGYCLL